LAALSLGHDYRYKSRQSIKGERDWKGVCNMATHVTLGTTSLRQPVRIEELRTSKSGLKRIRMYIEAAGQVGLTPIRFARFVNCTVHDATVLMDNLASVGAIKQRNNVTRTYAINPHYTGTVWCSLLM
jgi:hypothetical protein